MEAMGPALANKLSDLESSYSKYTQKKYLYGLYGKNCEQ